MQELPKAYEHKDEEKAYQQWESSGFFNPDNLPGRTPQSPPYQRGGRGEVFSISMPPPNVTGSLHIGHAMFLTIEDLMTRYARMQGKRALWVPGVDHAAIATQNVVEKQIYQEEGKTRHEIGREELVRRINEFVKGTRRRIETQIRRIGSSCDWSRGRYTLDTDLSLAVRTVFKMMYDDGLIYRGNRIVNWCPRCKSTLADDEVDYKEQKTKFYYFKYGPVVIGTARPETKFLDKTIIVHPKDKRYKNLVGKELEVEWIEGKIKANVIADPAADMEFGTGAMTITPAHSFEDFALAQKYKLPVVKIIDENGNLTEAAGSFAGRNARECRDEIVEILRKKGLVEKIDENYVHNLSLCYRCGTPVEPLPSLQWFVAVDKPFKLRKPPLTSPPPSASWRKGGDGEVSKLQFQYNNDTATLKELSLWAVQSGAIKIIPDRFNKTYFHWMENLHDWCISRQIWFGHQIPVWYKGNETHVDIDPPKGDGWEQDPDTLDTWFSSALWTFSTLGWPKKTKDFQAFHPTSVMETGYDILFFWVARMIIMTLYTVGEIPFRTVYLHGLVRDRDGKKMSKSAGNGIDPLDMIAKFGADPVRLSLVVGTTPGNDIRLYEEKIAGYRNFVNKLWNIGRFILTTASQDSPRERGEHKGGVQPQTLADQWILSELNSIIANTTKAMDEFRYSTAIENLYDFTWAKFADWYIEIAKFQRTQDLKESTDAILLYSLAQIIKLWHPFTPFITEELWSHLSRLILPLERGRQREGVNSNLLLIQPWPTPQAFPLERGKHKEGVSHFTKLQELITALRIYRAEHKVNPKEKLTGQIAASDEWTALLNDNVSLINHLARTNLAMAKIVRVPTIRLNDIQILLDSPRRGVLQYAPTTGANKSKKENREDLQRYIKVLKTRLSDSAFLQKAPPHVVEKERKRLHEMEEKIST